MIGPYYAEWNQHVLSEIEEFKRIMGATGSAGPLGPLGATGTPGPTGAFGDAWLKDIKARAAEREKAEADRVTAKWDAAISQWNVDWESVHKARQEATRYDIGTARSDASYKVGSDRVTPVWAFGYPPASAGVAVEAPVPKESPQLKRLLKLREAIAIARDCSLASSYYWLDECDRLACQAYCDEVARA